MNINQKSLRIWKQPTILIPCILLLLILSGLCLFRFANPQWNKYIYMFQAYVWPGQGPMAIPSDYDGVWTEWYSNGQKKGMGELKNGTMHGTSMLWDENGHKQLEQSFKDGKEHGRTIIFRPDQTCIEENYRNGKLHGRYTAWYPNGQKSQEWSYKEDKSDGIGTYWYENGKKKSEIYMKDGERQGTTTEWDEHGNVICKGRYVMDKESEGSFSNYRKGIVEHYENGKLIRTENLNAQPANTADREGAAADL